MPLSWVKQISIVPLVGVSWSKCLELALQVARLRDRALFLACSLPTFYLSQGYFTPLPANGATLSEH